MGGMDPTPVPVLPERPMMMVLSTTRSPFLMVITFVFTVFRETYKR